MKDIWDRYVAALKAGDRKAVVLTIFAAFVIVAMVIG